MGGCVCRYLGVHRPRVMCEGQGTAYRSESPPASLLLKPRLSHFSAHTFIHWATLSSPSPLLFYTVTQPVLISASPAYIKHSLLFLGIRWYDHEITNHLPSTAEHSDSQSQCTCHPYSPTATSSVISKKKKKIVCASCLFMLFINPFQCSDFLRQRKSLKLKS